jgi:hypothetical protein
MCTGDKFVSITGGQVILDKPRQVGCGETHDAARSQDSSDFSHERLSLAAIKMLYHM